MRTTEQLRSEHARLRLKHAAEKLDDAAKKELRGEVEGLPGKLRVNGLLPVVAYLSASDDDSTKTVIKALSDWLMKPDSRIDWGEEAPAKLLERLSATGGRNYRLATEEALAYARWLKVWLCLIPKKDGKKDAEPESAPDVA